MKNAINFLIISAIEAIGVVVILFVGIIVIGVSVLKGEKHG